MLIDTHCHLTYADLAPQIDAVLERAREAGVDRCITVATSPSDAREAVALIADRPELAMSAGIHPHEAGKAGESDLAALRDLHTGNWRDGEVERLVAVGETGLDFHYDFATPEEQERVFRYQLGLACDIGRPVVIHAREAEGQCCDVLADFPALRDRVVFHCFSGTAALARRILDMGFWLSYTGVVTFAKADAIRESAKLTPDDRILVETDAPYLSPVPHRKVRPNEPALVVHTARCLAELRETDFKTFAEQTSANAERFFGLSKED